MIDVLAVLAVGPSTTFQDLGRPGFASLGVGRSGAFDRTAHARGARLLGNDPATTAVEVTFGGLAVRALRPAMLALTGADCGATIGRRLVGPNSPFYLAAGDELVLGRPGTGLRSYLSVRGGFGVAKVLGSASTDSLSGIGPPRLRTGDVLAALPTDGPFPGVDTVATPAPDAGLACLDVLPGPRADWLADPSGLATTRWIVAPDSDRIGIRLDGPPLPRHPDRHLELPSEGVVRGAVQLPADGRPLIFGPDHPVTGGYPVVGVLTDQAADRSAQLRPGQPLRFRLITPAR